MKIRIGFVSNSSTSSFMIYGATIGLSKYKNIDVSILDILLAFPKENFDNLKPPVVLDYDETLESYLADLHYFDYGELLAQLVQHDNLLDIYAPDNFDTVYIGASIDKMGLDETKREFQERITSILQKNMPNLPAEYISWYLEEWSNY